MNIVVLEKKDIAETMDLFCKSFFDDHHYAKLFPNISTRAKDMVEAFQNTILYCISLGSSLGIRDHGKLVGFIICFDYKYIRDNDNSMFRTIFAGKDTASLPYNNTLHSAVSHLPGDVMYCLSLAVDPAYQRSGIASAMWDCVISRFPNACFAADVSNCSSLEIYRKRNFNVQLLNEEYYLVSRTSALPSPTLEIDSDVKLIVPNTKILDQNCIEYVVLKAKTAVGMSRIETRNDFECFVKDDLGLCFGTLVLVSIDAFLQYQRAINVAHYDEIVCSEYVYYTQNTPYTYYPLGNDTLNEMLKTRSKEWAIIPDVFVSIPVQYDQAYLNVLDTVVPDARSQLLLHDLDFRTHYESGIPATSTTVDDLANFKKRINRVYLGKVEIQITCENTVDQYNGAGMPIGEPVAIDMFLSKDEMSTCGVLTWYSLSAPFLISQLLDNIIRNQVVVVANGNKTNLFEYLNATFGIIRRGSPKSFVVIPKDKSCLTESQIASLLASETIYPDGETYGEVIDPEITSVAQSELGMGQYNRAFVAAYTNVLLQFNGEAIYTLRDRLYDESITLFYIELILFEEAAITVVDHEIVNLLTTTNIKSPVDFLQHVDQIYGDYSRTIDFWAIQVNYPTSQKSIDMLRTAFKITEKLEYMKRNQEQLQIVFDTKCDIIDRKDAMRMNKSLAILSVLAIFSAWIDGYDYVSTWDDLLSDNLIYVIQKALFVLVLITAIYAVMHLFGGKIGLLIGMKRIKNKRKSKRNKRKDKTDV